MFAPPTTKQHNYCPNTRAKKTAGNAIEQVVAMQRHLYARNVKILHVESVFVKCNGYCE